MISRPRPGNLERCSRLWALWVLWWGGSTRRSSSWFTYPNILRDNWLSSRITDPGPNTSTFSRSYKRVRHTARQRVVLSDRTQKTGRAYSFHSVREAAPSIQSSHIHRRHARQGLCRFNQPDTTPQPQVRRRRRRVRRRSTRTLRRARVRRHSVQRARLMP